MDSCIHSLFMRNMKSNVWRSRWISVSTVVFGSLNRIWKVIWYCVKRGISQFRSRSRKRWSIFRILSRWLPSQKSHQISSITPKDSPTNKLVPYLLLQLQNRRTVLFVMPQWKIKDCWNSIVPIYSIVVAWFHGSKLTHYAQCVEHIPLRND